MQIEKILSPGRNYWKSGVATRAAMLADGDAFFQAFSEALLSAKHSVILIGWDFDFQTPLRGNGTQTFSNLLLDAVRRTRGLHVHILEWDFAMIYAFERGIRPLLGIACPSHRRIHFYLDEKHPLGGSHHQKVIVADDRVAFVGGLDVTRQRWDTSDHIPGDPRRTDATKTLYGPYHDVQMIAEGPVARLLGDLARERWKFATGKTIKAPDSNSECWPEFVTPEFNNVEVAISRTFPAHDETREIREVQNLYCDAIKAAQKWIYAESQYLTAACIMDAIEQRLSEPQGPEIVLVLPKACSGWLEENTMDAIRTKSLRRLMKADIHKHLRIYYPAIENEDIHVHSKLVIVDDDFLTIGSANMSNRSMGLDTECNLTIEAQKDPQVQSGIKLVRDRLLGEHLGLRVDQVQNELDQHGSILKLIQMRKGTERRLETLEVSALNETIVDEEFIDPERPIEVERWLLQALPAEEKHRRLDFLRLTALLLLAGLIIAGIWHWTSIREYLDPKTLADAGRRFAANPASPFIVISSYIAGVIILFPVTILTLATILIFGPVSGFAYAALGSICSASATYWIGRFLGRRYVRKVAGRRLNQLSRFLASRGILTVCLATMLPLAPFGVVNMVAGVSRIRFRDFVIGSALGVLPPIAGMTIFERGLQTMLRHPTPSNLLIIIVVAAALFLASIRFHKWIRAKEMQVSI